MKYVEAISSMILTSKQSDVVIIVRIEYSLRALQFTHVVVILVCCFFFFFSSRRRHTRFDCDWSSDVCSSDLLRGEEEILAQARATTISPAAAGPVLAATGSGLAEPERVASVARRPGVSLREIGRASCRERV